MSLDGQGGKQPSPVAKERRARSITISNTKVEPEQSFSNEAKHDILDQEALLDFTHPELRRSCPRTSVESRHQTHSESQKQAPASHSSYSLQGKVGLSNKENSSKDKPKPPPRNLDFSAIPKPQSDIKQQQEFLPSGATGTQAFFSQSEGIKSADVYGESQSVLDGLPTQRKCTGNSQNRYYSHTAGFASNNKSYEQMYSGRNTTVPMTPKMSFSTERLSSQSLVSPNIETRRRRFDLHNDAKVDATFLPGSNLRRPKDENNTRAVTGNSSPTLFQQTGASRLITSPQRNRFWSKAQSQTAQMDVLSTVSQSDCLTQDYSCQSRRDIDQKMEVTQHAHRLNRLKTCLVAPQTQEASQTGSSSKPDIPPQRHLSGHEQSLGQNKKQKEVKLSDTGLNQTDIFAPPDHHHHSAPTKLLEYPSEKCVVSGPPSVARCPFNTNSSGTGSKGVFDLQSQPQHRAYQRPEETTTSTTASLPPKQVDYSQAKRAFIMEEPEDPYYVTMYYPGSVYVGE